MFYKLSLYINIYVYIPHDLLASVIIEVITAILGATYWKFNRHRMQVLVPRSVIAWTIHLERLFV